MNIVRLTFCSKYWQTFQWMTLTVTGAVRIMPAVGRGIPGTSTGVIEIDSGFTQQCYTFRISWTVLSICDGHLVSPIQLHAEAHTDMHRVNLARLGSIIVFSTV